MNADFAIAADSLTRQYRSGGSHLTVFDGLSLHVSAGEKVAIVGESGSGKSTLLHLLGGLDRPNAGQILFAGVDILSYNADRLAEFRNRQVGFVWQNPSLLPEFTALENVTMPLLIRGLPGLELERIGRERLAEVGLSNRAHHRAGELSGGEQQRVAIARALVGGPSYLLADEPTGSVDTRTAEALANVFSEVHARNRLTSVFVTHSHSFARKCDRVLELKKGKLQIPDREDFDSLQGTKVIPGATRLHGGTYV